MTAMVWFESLQKRSGDALNEHLSPNPPFSPTSEIRSTLPDTLIFSDWLMRRYPNTWIHLGSQFSAQF